MIIDMSNMPLNLNENLDLLGEDGFEYASMINEINYELSYISDCLLELNVIKRTEIPGFKFGIEVDGPGLKDNNFKKDPYFKIWRGSNNFTSAKPKDRTRISLLRPEYIDHNNVPGTMKLNASEKDALINALNTKISKSDKEIDGKNPETVYEFLLACTNNVAKVSINDEYYRHLDTTPMADYKQLGIYKRAEDEEEAKSKKSSKKKGK